MLSGSIRMEGMQEFFQYWMDKESLTNITAKWFLIITVFFPPFKFSIIRITYMLKVLCVANSDTKIQIFKLHTHCKNYMYLIVLSIFVTLMQENPEYSVFSLQTVGFYCILVGLFRKLGIFAKTNPKVGKL